MPIFIGMDNQVTENLIVTAIHKNKTMDWITINGQCAVSISKMLTLWKGKMAYACQSYQKIPTSKEYLLRIGFIYLFLVKSRHTWSANVNYPFKQVRRTELWTPNIEHELTNKSTSFTIFTLSLFLTWFNGIPWIFPASPNSDRPFGGWHFLRLCIYLKRVFHMRKWYFVSKQSISLNFISICLFMQRFPTFAWKSPRRTILFRGFFFVALGGFFLVP